MTLTKEVWLALNKKQRVKKEVIELTSKKVAQITNTETNYVVFLRLRKNHGKFFLINNVSVINDNSSLAIEHLSK